MNIKISSHLGTDLSSRARAAQFRAEVLSAVARDGRVVLDFSSVRTLSDSFSDELFAVLVDQQGEEWFKRSVHLVGLDGSVRISILEAVLSRQQRV